MNLETIKKIKKDPSYLLEVLNSKGYLSWVPDKHYLKFQYKRQMGTKLNLVNPQNYNEKLQWLKLYNRNPLYTELVDKYEVRKHIIEILGEDYLIPLLGVWDSVEDINWESLPSQFVLKCTHDSGRVIICKNKSELNLEEAKKLLDDSLKRNYYQVGREWPYKNIKPKIIAEKYIFDENAEGLNDYKFYCFNGEPKLFFIATERNKNVKFDFFDLELNHLPIGLRNSDKKFNIPQNFQKMVKVAAQLSKNIPHVRIDLYNVNNKIYFSEFTFFSDSGYEKFHPNHEKYSNLLGSWIELPNK